MTLFRTLAVAALLGLGVPILYTLIHIYRLDDLVPDGAYWFFTASMAVAWPSFILMLAGGANPNVANEALIASFTINALWYVILGTGLWYGLRKHRAGLVVTAGLFILVSAYSLINHT